MPPNKSLDASGGSASRNLLDAAKGALIRAAASTQPLGGITHAIIIALSFDHHLAERGTFAVSEMRPNRGYSQRHNLRKGLSRSAKLRKHSQGRRTNALLDLAA
jgi:hypothetical protein